jgi:uncharacterized protein with NRDE domain
MCIAVIIVNYSERFPLIVCHNREEDISRQTSDLMLNDGILSAIDLKAGGVAAVGLNTSTGTFAMLTNCRMRSSLRPEGSSRGAILKDVLLEGVSESVITRVKSDTFQGDFHMYTGNVFVKNTVHVNYLTNITCESNFDTHYAVGPSEPMHVIVRMNEHPDSFHDWKAKLNFVESSVRNLLITKRDVESVDYLLHVIESGLSRLGPFRSPDTGKTYEWSQMPEGEDVAQTHVIFPATQLSNCTFGTVSETRIIVDRQRSEVHYKYRTVTHEREPLFGPWKSCTLNYPS